MKVYKRIVLSIETGKILEEDSREYSGPIAECKGGGGTTTTEVPEWQRPYLEDIFGQASGLGQQNIQYYPGTTVSPFAPEQTAAQAATTNRALWGSPLLGQGQAELSRTVTGGGYGQEYVNPLAQGQIQGTIGGLGYGQEYVNPLAQKQIQGTIGGLGYGQEYINRPASEQIQAAIGGQGYGQEYVNPLASAQTERTMAGGGYGQEYVNPLASAQTERTMAGGGYGQEYVNPPASAQIQATMGGTYLDPNTNPWLAKTYETAAKDVARTFGQVTAPAIRKEAMGTGAFGGARQGVAEGAAATGFAESLGGLAAKIYGPAHETERARQAAMAAEQAQLTNQQYQAERARQVGTTAEQTALANQQYQAERGRQVGTTAEQTALANQQYQAERTRQLAMASEAAGLTSQEYQAERARQVGMAGEAAGLTSQQYQAERARQLATATGAAELTNQQYQAERARQMAAMTQAPAFAEADYGDIGKLAAVGQEKQAMDQAQIDAAMQAWQFSQMEPWQRLGMYSNLITGDVGGTTMSTGGGK